MVDSSPLSIIMNWTGPSGILGPGGKQYIAYAVGRESVRIVALSISSHEQTQQNQGCFFLIL